MVSVLCDGMQLAEKAIHLFGKEPPAEPLMDIRDGSTSTHTILLATTSYDKNSSLQVNSITHMGQSCMEDDGWTFSVLSKPKTLGSSYVSVLEVKGQNRTREQFVTALTACKPYTNVIYKTSVFAPVKSKSMDWINNY